MKQTQFINLIMLILITIAYPGFAQQNVTIGPNDDVLAILETIVEPDSTITFEAGHYQLAPPADTLDEHALLTPPPGTTIRGAGSGMDPAVATIIDGQFLFQHVLLIEDQFDGVTVEDITLIQAYNDLIVVGQDTFEIVFNNVWGLKALGDCIEAEGGDTLECNFCVFGWSSADTVHNEDDNPGIEIYTNCDIFLGESDLIDADNGQVILRNCIVYAGNGSNDVFNDNDPDGRIIARASVGWDPFDGDPPGITETLWGRLDVDSDFDILPDIDGTNIGEDPLYVAPPSLVSPGVANLASQMDLRLRPGSPALTAGSTAFDADHNPIGDPTFAGSQGPAPDDADVMDWPIH